MVDNILISMDTVDIFSDRSISYLLLPRIGTFSTNSMTDSTSTPLTPFKYAAFYDGVAVGSLSLSRFILFFLYNERINTDSPVDKHKKTIFY